MSVAARVVKGRFGSYELEGEQLKVPGSSRIYRIVGSSDTFYKELGTPLAGAEEIERIEELVKVGSELGHSDLSSSRGRIAWPRDVVIEAGEVAGVLTPYAGDAFYNTQIGKRLMPRHLTYLRLPAERVPVEIRLRLMRQLAGVLALLEHVDLVHGDVAAQNVLWTLTPRPSIFLIDCDGMHNAAVEGVEGTTEGWADPRKEAKLIASHDMRSDWFALALAIWRVTTLSPGTPEHGPHEVILPPGVPAPFREPLVRTFEDVMDPDPRPSPREWLDVLDQVLGSGRARRRVDRLAASSAPVTTPREPTTTPKPPPAPGPRPATHPRAGSRPRRRLRRILAWSLVLACPVLIGTSFLDSGPSARQLRAEQAVARWARPRLATRRIEVSCPADSSLHAGARYLCTVETPGGALARVRVAVKRGGAAERRMNLFAFRERAVVRDLRAAYRYFQGQGLDRGLLAASCPETISAKPGTRFQCSAEFTDGSEGRIVGHMRRRPDFYGWREVGAGLFGRNEALR